MKTLAAIIRPMYPICLQKNINMTSINSLSLAAPVRLLQQSKGIKTVKSVLGIDSTTIHTRHFNNAAIDKYLSNPNFIYTDDNTIAQTSFWQRFWYAFFKFLSKLFSNHQTPHHVDLSYIPLIIGILLIAGLVIIITKMNTRNIFKKTVPAAIPYNLLSDDIHEVDFNAEITKAITENNYRLAVRLLYLSALKELNDAGQIKWKADKTNAAYVSELSGHSQAGLFRILTIQFEYIWYGNFNISKTAFNSINHQFNQLKKYLHERV